mmetsp:Transcript_5254/g.15214  ORF Transcript_5254/g.15214 Transcript_5254/m.15214 type:complete len:672 (-) Transcript_5254:576-2591(-)|eukprot:CAMPEP_0113550100 /NCGR_PEP_ID=MMETSP0015_2-20120614/13798_1 /TAXON_ID=2838 /ORGANISM="Odontella" /LENGTH=671 /DNA_ID=CAMNT_0000450877 /DNA_START=152 /DNA_END=2167 /DNA_ORIENTATION=+ /assembly_acc=CAM_ASM_000160
MKVTFWGTRGSIAKPGPTTVKYGGNTSCIEVRSDAGDLVVLDCGTGGHGLGNALMAEMARTKKPLKGSILITHTHWDHIQGIPFFVPLYVPGNKWDVYGPRGISGSLREILAGQMQYTYFPVDLDYLGSSVDYHDLVEGTFHVGSIKVTAQYMNHPCLTLGYRLECDGVAFVYACDHEPHSQSYALGELDADAPLNSQDLRHIDFLRKADLVVHDAQYTREEYRPKVGWGHCTMECAIDMCQRCGVRRLGISHHDPLHDDAQLEQLVGKAMQTVLGRPLEHGQCVVEEGIAEQGSNHEKVQETKSEVVPKNVSNRLDNCNKEDNSCLQVFIAAEGKSIDLQPALIGLSVDEKKEEMIAEESCALTKPVTHEHIVLIGTSNNKIAEDLELASKGDKLNTVRANNAVEIIGAIQSERFSLVLLADGNKKDETLEICQMIRNLGSENHHIRTLPVIVVADKEDTEAGLKAGVTDWLVMPFTEQYARTRFRAWLLRIACQWRRADPPIDEVLRLETLRRLRVLDTDPEERLDKLTRIASSAFDMPIALVSLVDEERQWFKSSFGLQAKETPRDQAFCSHAIRGKDVLVVNDTLTDERFADNPLVTGGPRIRFYAGYPLQLSNGTSPGTLCIIDSKPRDLDTKKMGLLKELGGVVEKELERGTDLEEDRPGQGLVR